ncbi:hypothetical protein OG21DRAFT_1501156, partial [Imleria badia]
CQYKIWIFQRYHSHSGSQLGVSNISCCCKFGYDPAGICNVESIQKNYFCPPVHLCATGNCVLCYGRYILQSHHPPISFSCSSCQFLPVQCHIHQCLIAAQLVHCNPSICSWCYTFGSCCHPSLEAASRDV